MEGEPTQQSPYPMATRRTRLAATDTCFEPEPKQKTTEGQPKEYPGCARDKLFISFPVSRSTGVGASESLSGSGTTSSSSSSSSGSSSWTSESGRKAGRRGRKSFKEWQDDSRWDLKVDWCSRWLFVVAVVVVVVVVVVVEVVIFFFPRIFIFACTLHALDLLFACYSTIGPPVRRL